MAPDVLLRAINANLPRDIAVSEVAEAPDGFHAIRDAISDSSYPAPDLNAPATPEAILKAIEASRHE